MCLYNYNWVTETVGTLVDGGLCCVPMTTWCKSQERLLHNKLTWTILIGIMFTSTYEVSMRTHATKQMVTSFPHAGRPHLASKLFTSARVKNNYVHMEGNGRLFSASHRHRLRCTCTTVRL